MTDYAKWDKFDVSEAEENIEGQLQAQAYDEQRKKAQRTEEAQQKLASKELKQTSAAIASKAAVDALKAKGGPNRKATRWLRAEARSKSETAVTISQSPFVILSEGLELCLQQIEHATALMKNNRYSDASVQLFDVVQQIRHLRGSMTHLDEATQHAVSPTLLSLLTQTLDNISTCSTQQRLFASSADATRDLLLLLQNEFQGVDDIHWWVQRGKALLGMDTPYLASLHLNHAKLVATQKPKRRNTKLERDRVARFIAGDVTEEVVAYVKRVAEGVDSALVGFAEEMKHLTDQQLGDRYVTAVLSHTQRLEGEQAQLVHPASVLKAVRELYHEGLVTFREQFYRTAQCKFMAVLQILETMTEKSAVPRGNLQQAIRRICTCAHLNVAACLLNRQTGFEKALRHCEQALHLDNSSVIAIIRSAQACCEMHRFDDAQTKLSQAQGLIASQTSPSSRDNAVGEVKESPLTQYPLLSSLTKNSVSGTRVPMSGVSSSPQLLRELQAEIERVEYIKSVHLPH